MPSLKTANDIAVMLSMAMLCTVVLRIAVYANGADSKNLAMLNEKTMTNTDTVYMDGLQLACR